MKQLRFRLKFGPVIYVAVLMTIALNSAFANGAERSASQSASQTGDRENGLKILVDRAADNSTGESTLSNSAEDAPPGNATADSSAAAGEISKKIEMPRALGKPEYRNFNLGYAYGFNTYIEPTVMKESGHLNGLAFALESRPLDQALLLRLSGEFLFGGLAYEGSMYYVEEDRTEPWTTGTNDFIYSLKGVFGLPFVSWQGGDLGAFAGVGTRYLNDQIQGRGGYEREINYLFVPLGLEARFFLSNKRVLTLSAEYDRFVSGTVKSHLTEVGRSRDITNKQTTGHGHRFAADWSWWMNEGMDLHIAPYWQHWQVDDSDQVAMDKRNWYEPKNSTDQVGVTLSVGM